MSSLPAKPATGGSKAGCGFSDQCLQPAEADIRLLEGKSRFDPQRT